MEKKMFCPGCGSELDGNTICEKCGTDISERIGNKKSILKGQIKVRDKGYEKSINNFKIEVVPSDKNFNEVFIEFLQNSKRSQDFWNKLDKLNIPRHHINIEHLNVLTEDGREITKIPPIPGVIHSNLEVRIPTSGACIQEDLNYDILFREKTNSKTLFAVIRGIVGYGEARNHKMLYLLKIRLRDNKIKEREDIKVKKGIYKIFSKSSSNGSIYIPISMSKLAHPQVSPSGLICFGYPINDLSISNALKDISNILATSDEDDPYGPLQTLPNEKKIRSIGKYELKNNSNLKDIINEEIKYWK